LPEIISEKIGDDLQVVTVSRQACPTSSEIISGNHSKFMNALNPWETIGTPITGSDWCADSDADAAGACAVKN